jgi:excisionase family DNA binding protein
LILKYVTPKEAAKQLGVHFRTLARWEKEGKIEAIKTPSGQRRYNVQSYTTRTESVRTTVIYARVSSRAQQPDLNRQIAAIANLYPNAEIISEVGGGLNFKRKKLLSWRGCHPAS